MASVQLLVRPRWWLRHYLAAVVLGSWLTGMEPNMERVGWWLRRGLVLDIYTMRAHIEA